VTTPLPLEATLAVLPCRGGERLLRRLFEPLGYAVAAQSFPLDERFPAWGPSPYYRLGLQATVRVQDLIRHLYTLIPVLDDQKHYWVGDDEVEKLLRHGEGWLGGHPERQLITDRYLKHRRRLVDAALARLSDEDTPDPDAAAEAHAVEEAVVEERISLYRLRHEAVLAALKELGARRVLDLGCGEGKLLQALLADRSFTAITGMDVSQRALEIARERLDLDRLPAQQRERLQLLQGSLTYRDRRLAGYDAATVVEVIEHLDLPRLAAFERVLFDSARPAAVIITTPNVEYNVRFPTLPAGRLRHQDHRFEWTRAQFAEWAQGAAVRHGYDVRFAPLGPADPALGAPSQVAVFRRTEATPNG
jgi:3' terminal RNA ribose 2'-O-methyltransferase Hen1